MHSFFSGIIGRFVEHKPWCSVRLLFLVACVLSGGVLTWLGYIHILPLTVEYWLFYSFLLFLFASWRPSLTFLLLISLLPIEIISLTPAEWGVTLRPYQWVAFLLGLALVVRFLSGRLRLPSVTLTRIDWSLGVMLAGVFLAGVFYRGDAFQQAVIVGSFAYIYGLARIFIVTRRDAVQAVIFFIVPATVSLVWGLIQNILFLNGKFSWAVMPGRPNGTLAEPDWLGVLIIFLLAISLGWFIRELQLRKNAVSLASPFLWLVFILTMLILTVSRSAWLGAAVVMLVATFWMLLMLQRKEVEIRSTLIFFQLIAFAFGLALIIVMMFPLTRFPLFDRAVSTASHEQTITIACDEVIDTLPSSVERLEDLPAYYGCSHINLEDITLNDNQGKWITTIKRPDPNVSIRAEIYAKSIAIAQEHPFLGIGWGAIGPRLGIDERGASYNASNLWLEVWLGGGAVGLIGFCFMCIFIILRLFEEWRRQHHHVSTMILTGTFAGFLVFNFFNAGLLLGFVWVYLAFFSLRQPQSETNPSVAPTH